MDRRWIILCCTMLLRRFWFEDWHALWCVVPLIDGGDEGIAWFGNTWIGWARKGDRFGRERCEGGGVTSVMCLLKLPIQIAKGWGRLGVASPKQEYELFDTVTVFWLICTNMEVAFLRVERSALQSSLGHCYLIEQYYEQPFGSDVSYLQKQLWIASME